MIDFETVNRAALANLPALLARWFPAGTYRGREFVVGDLAGSPGESLSINTATGLWADFSAGGSERGSDPISLYAARCRLKQGEAAKALAGELGLDPSAAPGTSRAEPAPKAEPREIWEPRPIPADAKPPRLDGYNMVWTYRDADGQPIGYVTRKNITGKNGQPEKIIRPINWGWLKEPDRYPEGALGWHFRHPARPLPLYGLDLLAARPDAPVIVCEGEKAADAAGRMFGDHVCVTWARGVNNIEHVDWKPLAGRWVILWPDADDSNIVDGRERGRQGQTAMAKLAGMLAGIAADVVVLDVSDLSGGDDAADLTLEDPLAWLHAHTPQPEPEAPLFEDDEPPPGEYDDQPGSEDPPAPPPPPTTRQGEGGEAVIPLGHDRGEFYYYSRACRQVFTLTPDRHSRANLCAMASAPRYWERLGHLQTAKGGVDWAAAADWLMDCARSLGIYDPGRVRGRGAWIDEGRTVLNIGHSLIVDGEPRGLVLEGSRFIYEAGPDLIDLPGAPLRTKEAHKLVEICEMLRWERPVNGKLLAGWLVIAPISGALSWRPSIWLTGGAGSGKSYIVREVMRPVLSRTALWAKSSTTAAGLRAVLGSDARPVLFDEAERESASAMARMAEVLELVRQSSSADEGEIIKSTQSQKAKTFRIQSAFAFQSINVGVEHQADASRITTLALRDAGAQAQADIDRFAELQALVAEVLTPQFAGALLARSVSLAPIIRQNAETFAQAIAVTLGSRRLGDQLGALLAGAYSLHSSNAVTPDEARGFVAAGDWEVSQDAADERDEARLVRTLLACKLRVGTHEIPVSRLLEGATGGDVDDALPNPAAAMRALQEAGIKPEAGRGGRAGLYVSTNHPELRRILRDTPWSTGWGRSLARLPGAIPSTENPKIRFALGMSSRAVWIPLDTLDGAVDQF